MVEKLTMTERTILIDSREERIVGVRILDPASGIDRIGDAVIREGILQAILPPSAEPSGLWLLPGIVDMHVHLRVPGNEEAETLFTGLRAAVAGGVAAVGMMPNTVPPMDGVEETVRLAARANALGLSLVHPVPCVTLGGRGKMSVDLKGFAKKGIKVFTDDGNPVGSDEVLLQVFSDLSDFSGTLMEHPEIKELAAGGSVNLGEASRRTGALGIPERAEYEDVKRCIDLLEVSGSGAGLHLTHLSSPESVKMVHSAFCRGLPVTCDVTPHHLSLNEQDLIHIGPLAKMNPPLRSEKSRKELVELVRKGCVTAVASDHAPHPDSSKNKPLQEASFGITGLETLLPVTVDILVNEAGMVPLDVVSMLTSKPAEILGVPFHGLAPGLPCSMVLFDPEAVWTYDKTHSKSSNSPFLGREMKGRVLRVWIGREVYREGQFV